VRQLCATVDGWDWLGTLVECMDQQGESSEGHLAPHHGQTWYGYMLRKTMSPTGCHVMGTMLCMRGRDQCAPRQVQTGYVNRDPHSHHSLSLVPSLRLLSSTTPRNSCTTRFLSLCI
jgi:hypothetical protein